jgi:heme A synthase
MNASRLAADLVLIVHASFIAFVVLGLVLVWVGIAAGWQWTRNPWYRTLHLVAIAFVVLQAYLGIVCPLTELENALRLRGGQQAYEPAGFIQHWLHAMIFFTAPSWVFTLCYTLFGLAVVGTLILAPPRWNARRREQAVTG